METQKTLDSQSDLKEYEQTCKLHNATHHDALQRHCHQIVLYWHKNRYIRPEE